MFSDINLILDKTKEPFRLCEAELVNLRRQYHEKIRSFYDTEDTVGEGEIYDDDVLKINFGGKNLDIKRSVLTKPKFGWNLFSCLFHKR
jgi:hypothetical protein